MMSLPRNIKKFQNLRYDSFRLIRTSFPDKIPNSQLFISWSRLKYIVGGYLNCINPSVKFNSPLIMAIIRSMRRCSALWQEIIKFLISRWSKSILENQSKFWDVVKVKISSFHNSIHLYYNETKDQKTHQIYKKLKNAKNSKQFISYASRSFQIFGENRQ